MITNVLSAGSRNCRMLGLWLILFYAFAQNASAQTAVSFSPSRISFKTGVRIAGSGFSAASLPSVKFGTVSASVAFVSPSEIIAVPGAAMVSGSYPVIVGTTTLPGQITYVSPANTPPAAVVNRVISDFGGYWSSTAASADAALQPDTSHNMLAFGFGSKIYTTGANNATLADRGVSFEAGGDFRALPIDIVGSTSTGADNYILYGANIDGTLAAASLANAANVRVKDVLMDGIKGLDLGTGVTNINTNAAFIFDIARIADDKLNDDEPDIVITQIADPGAGRDVYYFTDAAGNVVGNPLYANLSDIADIGTQKVDLFLLPSSTAYETAVPASTGTSNGTRDIRMIGFKLGEFGITAGNYASIAQFKVFPGGTSDMAFTAYNANAIFIPAPAITTQPTVAASCPTASASGNVTFSVVAKGNGKYYQWKKDGVDIAGATGASYTIAGVNNSHIGSYTVEVSNVAGSVVSEPAFLGNQWTGAIDADWNKTGNWYCGLVPNTGLNANIPKVSSNNYPLLNVASSSSCKDLNIADGASVTISGSGSLDIAGNINKTGVLNAVDGTVRFVGTEGSQAIPANTFATNYIKNLTIGNTSGVALSGELNLTGILNPAAGTFATGNQLTLKSNAATTAVVAQVTGAVAGEMTIERYIPARRAFRFISSPVDATGTIRTNWQENGVDAPGWGTDITGAGAELNGFDASGSNNPSLFTYSHNNSASGTWIAAASTNVALSAGVAYRLMVRGDRTVNQHLNASPASTTTLRAHGTIKTGDVAVADLNTAIDGYTLIGNPYQAAVDMKALLEQSSTGLNKNFYYVWDPTRNTRGAYVTVNLDLDENNVAGSEAGRLLQPNHAFFVRTSGADPALAFAERFKDVASVSTPNLYRTATEAAGARIRFTLYEDAMLAQGGNSLDGFVVSFGENYSNAIDENDALKPVNQDESIGLANAGKVYSFESRSLPSVSDVLPISLTQYRNTNYTYKVQVQGIDNVNAYILDKYANTRTQLANNGETSISFAVAGADQASSAANRFDVVFETALGTDESAFADGIRVYPNPVTGNQFFVALPSGFEGNIALSMANLIGQEVYSDAVIATENVISVKPAKLLQSGIYLLTISNGKETTTKKLIVK